MITSGGTATLGLYDLKRKIDAFGGVDYFRPTLAGGYLQNARVMLSDGDIVKSTIDGNTNDPNVSMTGWINDRDTRPISLLDFNPKGDGTDDIVAFTAFSEALQSRAVNGGYVAGVIPKSPHASGKWFVNGLVHFPVNGLVLSVLGGIQQLSTDRTHTLLFAYDNNTVPAQPLNNVIVLAQKGVVIDGNGANMHFPMTQGDGSDLTSTVRFNRIDNLYFNGFHATNGPVDSCSVSRSRNWLGEQIETSFAGTYDSLNRLGNGFSATTDWDTVNWAQDNVETWGYGVLRNSYSHDNPAGTGGTAFNCTGVWFENCQSKNNLTAYSYEKQYLQPATKDRFGGFRNCRGTSCTDGFYIDDNGVTVDDLCSISNITARAGDVDKLHGNGVVVSACTNFYIGGTIKNIANQGIALFNGSGVTMSGQIGAKIHTTGSHGILDRGTSNLTILEKASIKYATGFGIYGHNSGGASYNEKGNSTLIVDGAWVEGCTNSAVFVDYKGVADIFIRGRNNCTARPSGTGIGIDATETLYFRVQNSILKDENGKQGFLIKASNTVSLIDELNNTGDYVTAPISNQALASVPRKSRVYSPTIAEAFRAQNTASTVNARSRISSSVSNSDTFVGTYLDALRTDSPANNAHKLIAGVFNGSTTIDVLNIGGTGTYFGSGLTDAKNTVDVGGSFGATIQKVSASGSVDMNVMTTQVDPTSANLTLALQSAAASTRHVHNFVFFGTSSNTVTISLGGGTFSDGTTSKVLSNASRTLKIHADATNNVWAIL